MRTKRDETTLTLDLDEAALCVALVAGLDPDKYAADEAKAVILKCRAFRDRPGQDKMLVIRR